VARRIESAPSPIKTEGSAKMQDLVKTAASRLMI
jgi:hypothetical protein